MGVAAIALRDCYLAKGKAIAALKNIFWSVLTLWKFSWKVIHIKVGKVCDQTPVMVAIQALCHIDNIAIASIF